MHAPDLDLIDDVAEPEIADADLAACAQKSLTVTGTCCPN